MNPSFDWLFWLLRATLFVTASMLLFRFWLHRFQIRSIALQRWICGLVIFQGCVLGAIHIPLPVLTLSTSEKGRADSTSQQDERSDALEFVAPQERWLDGDAGGIDRLASNESMAPHEDFVSASTLGSKFAAVVSRFHRFSLGKWNRILFMVWLAGMMAVVIWQFGTYMLFVLTLRTQPATRQVTAIWERLQREAGVKRALPILVSPRRGPVLCRLPDGYRLIVPVGFERMCATSQMEAILRHELSHYIRGDIWKACWLHALALPHWFNPAVWWTLAHFRRCAEWASDEAAASTLGERIEYARALQSIAGHTRISSSLFVYGAATHPLVDRVQRLLTSPTSEDSWMKKLIAIFMALALLTVQTVHIQLVANENDADIVSETKAKMKNLKAQKEELTSKMKALHDEAMQLGAEVKLELAELKDLTKDRTLLSDEANKRIDTIVNGGSEASQLKALEGVAEMGKEGIIILGAAAKKSSHRKVRQQALTTVGAIGRSSLPAVVFSYEDLDSEDRTHLVEVLAASDVKERNHLFHLIAREADAAQLKVMLRYADKADDKLAFLAALTREDDPAHNGILLEYTVKLKDDDAILLLFIATSSERLAPQAIKLAMKYKEKAFPVLAGSFESESVELRKAVVLAAKEIGGQGGKLIIQHALDSDNQELRQAAEEVLK